MVTKYGILNKWWFYDLDSCSLIELSQNFATCSLAYVMFNEKMNVERTLEVRDFAGGWRDALRVLKSEGKI